MTLEEIEEVKKLLSTPQNITLVPHKNPDGDAMGSCLAMFHYLRDMGHHPTVVTPNDYPDFLKWLPEADLTYRFDLQNRQSKRAINSASIIFLLDFNALHRVGTDMENTLVEFEGTYIMIDHHQQPSGIAKFLYSDTSISSTCQMVYNFIDKMGDLYKITPEIATCLYTGIMTDTGSFKFASTTSETHRIIADLIDKGAKNDRIHNNVYDTNSFNRLQLLGRALQKMVILKTLNTAYISLTQDDLNEFDYQKGDTEGVVNYALSIKGVIFAVIFIEDDEHKIIKISFRSKGSFSVNQFARKHFDGGGHDNAAGGKTKLSMNETIDQFLKIIPKYKNELLQSYED